MTPAAARPAAAPPRAARGASTLVPLEFLAERSSWRMGRTDHRDRVPSGLVEEVRIRDNSCCRYCGVPVFKGNCEIDHADGNHANNDPENLRTACELCHDWRHLGRPNLSQEAVLIYAPMISPSDLQHVMRAAFIAKAEGGPLADGARGLLRLVFDFGKEAAQSLLGTTDPTVLGGSLVRYPPDQQRKLWKKLQGIAMVPTGIRGAGGSGAAAIDLFPQMIKNWQQYSYNSCPGSTWDRLFESTMKSISVAWRKIDNPGEADQMAVGGNKG